MKINPEEALPLALLDMEEARGTALCTRLQTLRHACFPFSCASDLISALSSGRRFALLLSVLQDGASLGGLPAACQVLGMPVLVVVPGGQWRLLSSKADGFESGGTIGADASRMADAELDWLVRALILRNKNASPAVAPPGDATQWGDYRFLESSRCVQLNGQEIRLQPRQFALALQFFRNVGRVVERDWLWRVMWRMPALQEGKRALDACTSGVRKKLELNGEHGFLLRSVYGQGYQLIEVQPQDTLAMGTAVS